MKKILTIILNFVLFFFILVSCTNNSMDGIYKYQEPPKEKKSILTYGLDLGCSLVGEIKLENGYYYAGLSGNRSKFYLEKNKVIVKGVDGNEMVIQIIDRNTLFVNGCTFVKSGGELSNENEEKIKEENKSTNNISREKHNKKDLKEEIKPFNQKSEIFNDFDGCGYFFAKNKNELDENNLIFAGFLYDEPSQQERFIKLVLNGKIEKLTLISLEKDKKYNFENKDYIGEFLVESLKEGENRTLIYQGEILITSKTTKRTYYCKVYGENVC